MPNHLEQMQIQAMLAAGRRCVKLERHSLLLWGSIGGGLCAISELAFGQGWLARPAHQPHCAEACRRFT